MVDDPVALLTVDRIHYSRSKAPAKRKFASLSFDITAGNAGYPSPPMSSPPSPSRQPPDPTIDYLRGPTYSAPGTSAPREAFQPPLAFSAQHEQASLAPPPYPGPPQYPSSIQPQLEMYPGPPSYASGAPSSAPVSTASTVGAATGTTGPSGPRAVRRSKAHVASACVNCKRAHLSCDVQRPCARCVASGKQVGRIIQTQTRIVSADLNRIPAMMCSTRSVGVQDFEKTPSSKSSKCYPGL